MQWLLLLTSVHKGSGLSGTAEPRSECRQCESGTVSHSAVLSSHGMSVHRMKSKVFRSAFKAAGDQVPAGFSGLFLCLDTVNYLEFLVLPSG